VRDFLAKDNLALLHDLPGHGASSAAFTRVAIREFIEEVAHEVTSQAKLPVILMGESLGCSLLGEIGSTLERLGRRPAGYTLLAPPVILNVRSLVRWSILDLLDPRRGRPLTEFSLERPLRECVDSLSKLKSLQEDGLVKHRFGISYLLRVADSIRRLPAGLRAMNSPVLLLQGTEDPLLTTSNLSVAVALCKAPMRTAVRVDGARHSLLWDSRTEQVVARTRAWIEKIL
jgi:alpha-beta hydrolase superfamily lysophospholipase